MRGGCEHGGTDIRPHRPTAGTRANIMKLVGQSGGCDVPAFVIRVEATCFVHSKAEWCGCEMHPLSVSWA